MKSMAIKPEQHTDLQDPSEILFSAQTAKYGPGLLQRNPAMETPAVLCRAAPTTWSNLA